MARTDVQLMLDVKAGDEQSFELLLLKYRTPLVNFLYRMVHDSAVAEDLAQEVFLRVHRARKEYAPSAKFTTWMFRIATNLALNSVRDNRHRQMEISLDQTVKTGDDEQRTMEVPDRTPSVEQRLLARSRSEMILRATEKPSLRGRLREPCPSRGGSCQGGRAHSRRHRRGGVR